MRCNRAVRLSHIGLVWVFSSPCVSCSNWKVISLSRSTFPTSLNPLCPASLSPFIRLGQMSTSQRLEGYNTLLMDRRKEVEEGAHSDLGSSNVTVQCVAIVLLSMICSNSWCSLLGLATTTYNPHVQKHNKTTGHSRLTMWTQRLTFPPVRSASFPSSSSLHSVPFMDSTDTVTLTKGGQ